MSIIVQHRRDVRTTCEANTPAAGEYWFDTTLKTIRLGDGATLGGFLQKLWGRAYKIAPAQITGNQNDYSPTDLAIAEQVNLNSDAARTITGLALGAINRELTLRNKGSFNITLAHQSASSTAANRFDFGSDDVVLRPGDAIKLHYDDTSSRWGKAGGGTKVSRIPEELLLSGVLTPAQITGNQNDYAPAGITTAAVLRLNTDASRNITGIVDPRSGALKHMVNVGSNAIVLKNADAGSSAANRFDFGADVTLAAKQSITVEYDATDSRWKMLGNTAGGAVGDGAVTAVKLASSGIGHGPLVNGYLEWTVAGSALTVALKTLAGTDPTASDPVLAWVRNATAAPASGTPTHSLMTITAALSLVVSSGSSLGVAAGSTAFRIWAVLFNDAGTPRLGVINCLSGTDVYPIGDWQIGSSTAEGGAGGADSVQTFYTGAAVAAKAYAIIGYATWETGIASVGTWSAGPTRVQMAGPGVTLPGKPVQLVRTSTAAGITGIVTMPLDDTIPLNTEGDQYLSKAITPVSAANILKITSHLQVSNSAVVAQMAALFQDSIANALAVVFTTIPVGNYMYPLDLQHQMLAATTAATTFKVRSGANAAGTTTVNGQTGARLFGGVSSSWLNVEEIMA